MPSRYSGLFFSVSGFSQTAIDDVRNHREYELLLFDKPEIDLLLKGEIHVGALIRRKRRSLAEDGKLFFSRTGSLWEGLASPNEALFPTANIELRDTAHVPIPWVRSHGGYGQPVVVQDLPDPDWKEAQGHSVCFDIPLPLHRARDIPYLFDLLRRTVGLTAAGRFRISQKNHVWHGAGASALLNAIPKQRERYEGLSRKDLHHTDEIAYYDVCQNGFYTVTTQIVGQGPDALLQYSDFSARLAGIPLNASAFQELAEALDLEHLAHFRPLDELLIWSSHDLLRSMTGPRVEIVGYLKSDWDEWISGVLVRNPFYEKRAEIDAFCEHHGPLMHALEHIEILPCQLLSHHERGDVADYYFLERYEVTRTGRVVIVDAFADWHDLAQRAHPESAPREHNSEEPHPRRLSHL